MISAPGASADAPGVHFHGKGRGGKRHLQRRFLRKRGAAEKSCDAVCLYNPSREKVNLENPQIFQIYKY